MKNSLDRFIKGFIEGASSIVIEADYGDVSLLLKEIECIIEPSEVELYSVEPAWSLEDAYRGMTSHE